MSWQYAQLTIIEDSRPNGCETTRTVVWQEPGQGLGENVTESDHTVLQLMNRFGADGWELVAIQEHHEGLAGGRSWDSPFSQVTYTFKQHIT
jgi:hypothetical protein